MTGPPDGAALLRMRTALNGLAGLLLAQENVQSVLQHIVDLVAEAMPAGTQVSITLLRNEQPTTAAYTAEPALQLDETQYERGYGPCLEAALGGVVISIPDGRTEDRWPDYMPAFLDGGALSLLAAPVPAAQLAAGLNLYAPMVDAFTDEHRRAVLEVAGYAGVALTNMDALQDARDLAENLQKAMDFRAVIEQAKGILMDRHKLTADQAFRLLVEASMHANRKVRDIAEALVLTGELSPGAPTQQARPAGRPPANRRPGRQEEKKP